MNAWALIGLGLIVVVIAIIAAVIAIAAVIVGARAEREARGEDEE